MWSLSLIASKQRWLPRRWASIVVGPPQREAVLTTCLVECVFDAALRSVVIHGVHGEGVVGVEGETTLVAEYMGSVVA